jgi:ankyrin repeat protein
MIAAKNWHFECVKILLMDDVFTKIEMNPETRGQFITTRLCNSSTQNPIPQLPTLVIKNIFAFFQQKTSLDATNNMGQTALYLAAADGHVDCVKILLYYKCNKNIADKDGKTPLQIATENNHQECATELQKTQAEIENDYYEL